MSTAQLKKDIKKAVDALPPDRLRSLADYAGYLAGDRLRKEIAVAEKAFASGKGVNWKTVRKDV